MIGRAIVLARRDKVVVVGASLTPDQFYVANEWSRVLPADASDEDLGAAVLSALASTRFDIPQPGRDFSPEWLAVLDLMDVRSHAALMKGAREVGVEADALDEPIRCAPKRNTGRGFRSSEQPDVEVDRRELTDARLGAAVREALSRSE